MNNIVKEGDEGYALWKDRWPIMYSYNIDPSKLGDVECLFTPIQYIRNEYFFDDKAPQGFSDWQLEYGVIEDIRYFPLDENPIFTDPTHGDYSIREGADILDNHFYEIGRY